MPQLLVRKAVKEQTLKRDRGKRTESQTKIMPFALHFPFCWPSGFQRSPSPQTLYKAPRPPQDEAPKKKPQKSRRGRMRARPERASRRVEGSFEAEDGRSQWSRSQNFHIRFFNQDGKRRSSRGPSIAAVGEYCPCRRCGRRGATKWHLDGGVKNQLCFFAVGLEKVAPDLPGKQVSFPGQLRSEHWDGVNRSCTIGPRNKVCRCRLDKHVHRKGRHLHIANVYFLSHVGSALARCTLPLDVSAPWQRWDILCLRKFI